MLNRDCERGITLLETLVVIAIISILVMVGYPNLIKTLRQAEAREVESIIMMAFREARASSYTTKNNVIVCLADISNNCKKDAGEKILVFRDIDNNQKLNDKNKELIKEYALNLDYGKMRMNVSATRNYIKYFGSTGTPKGHFGHIKYCSSAFEQEVGRRIIISQVGNARVERKVEDCNNNNEILLK